jgi:amino acid transporter
LVKAAMLFLTAWAAAFCAMAATQYVLARSFDLRAIIGFAVAFLAFAFIFAAVQLPLLQYLRRRSRKNLGGRWYRIVAVSCGIVPVLIINGLRMGGISGITRAETLALALAGGVFGLIVGDGFYRRFDCNAERH